MDNRITLNKLISYISSINKQNDDIDVKNNYKISSFKNDLAESLFKVLKFGEVNTLGD